MKSVTAFTVTLGWNLNQNHTRAQILQLSLTHTSSSPSPISPLGLSHRSGGDHAFVPLAVGHAAPVVVGYTALVGLLLSPVQ